jgi:hypothetical protein
VPDVPQTVIFYFSTMPGITYSSSITGDNSTGWQLTYPLEINSSNTTNVDGMAQLTFSATVSGTYYFMAEDATPT